MRNCFVKRGTDIRDVDGAQYRFECHCEKGKFRTLSIDRCPSLCASNYAGAYLNKTTKFEVCDCKQLPWPFRFEGGEPPEHLRFWLESTCPDRTREKQNTTWHVSPESKLVWLDSDKRPWCVRPSSHTFRTSDKQYTFKLDRNCGEDDVVTVWK